MILTFLAHQRRLPSEYVSAIVHLILEGISQFSLRLLATLKVYVRLLRYVIQLTELNRSSTKPEGLSFNNSAGSVMLPIGCSAMVVMFWWIGYNKIVSVIELSVINVSLTMIDHHPSPLGFENCGTQKQGCSCLLEDNLSKTFDANDLISWFSKEWVLHRLQVTGVRMGISINPHHLLQNQQREQIMSKWFLELGNTCGQYHLEPMEGHQTSMIYLLIVSEKHNILFNLKG